MKHHRDGFCSKTSQATEKDARAHMIYAIRGNGRKRYGKVRVYNCDICGYWHFGHRMEGRQRGSTMLRMKFSLKGWLND